MNLFMKKRGEPEPPRKIGDFKDFPGKEILLEAQKRGAEIVAKSNAKVVDFSVVTLIGLANMLAERGWPEGK